MAPYFEADKTNSRKTLSILPYITIFIRAVLSSVCNLFKWNSEDYFVDTKQNDGSPLEVNSNISTSTTKLSPSENLRRQLQQFYEIKEGLEAEFSTLTRKEKHVQELFRSIFDRSSIASEVHNEFKKPRMEQGAAIEYEPPEIKKAVENSVNCKCQAPFKQMESKTRETDNVTREPDMIQCPGGNGANSKDQGAQSRRKESKHQQCNLSTTKPSGVCENNNGGLGDDGGDPPKKNLEFPLKGHYQELPDSPTPQKIKVKPDSSCKAQSEVISNSINCSSNIEPVTNETGSSTMVDPLMDDNILDMLLTDDNNEHVETSDNEGNESIVYEDETIAMEHDPLVNDSSLSDGSNAEHDKTSGNENIANPVSETPEGRDYPDNIPLERNDQHEAQTHSVRSPRRIIHPIQASLTVHNDGLYLINRDYIILDEIGRGGSGVCHAILDLQSSKTFAVKKIRSSDYQSNEIEVWSMFSPTNSNVVQLLGAYDDGTHVHIFMELMDGTLKYVAENRQELNVTERRVAAIIKQVLKFLDSSHRRGFVHADIKSDNIFFDSNGINVGDFGLSVSLSGESTTTANNGGRGTICFMPRELFLGDKCKPSVDIYCLGGVLIHLLSGSLPWARHAWPIIIYKVGSGETPDIPNNCSQQMRDLLELMLHPHCTKRPSATELLQHPVFTDTPESILDDELQELLVDIQLFRRPIAVAGPLQSSDALDCAPMSLDGEEEPPNAE